MRLTLLAAALAPLLVAAETYPAAAPPTATLTSTARFTKTITVSEVVASVYLAHPASSSASVTSPEAASTTVATVPTSTIVSSANSSTTVSTASVSPTLSSVYVNIPTGGASPTGSTGNPSNPLPPDFEGAASSLSGMWAGGAGLMACAVAMML